MERCEIAWYRDTVQLDASFKADAGHRQDPCLMRHSEQEHVGGSGVAEQRSHYLGRWRVVVHLCSTLRIQTPFEFAACRIFNRRVQDHRARGRGRRRADHDRSVRRRSPQLRFSDGTEQVEGQHDIDFAGGSLVRAVVLVAADVQITHDRAGLLRKSRLIESVHVEAIEHRCCSNDLAQRDHTRATDTGHSDREAMTKRSEGRLRDGRRRRRRNARVHLGRSSRWNDRGKAGTVAL